MNCFNYKGYQGSIETSLKDRCLFGKFLNDYIKDVISKDVQSINL